jgi:signal transduction histidine kinase
VIRFGSLRGRLLAGFALVIVVSLFTAGSAVVWLVQNYQRRLAVDRLAEVAMSAALAGRQLEAAEAQPDEIASMVSSRVIPESGVGRVRVLVLDTQSRVVADQPGPAGPFDPTFMGRRLDLPGEPAVQAAPGQRQDPRRAPIVAWADADVPGRPYLIITSPAAAAVFVPQLGPGGRPGQGQPRQGQGDSLDRLVTRAPAYRVVLAVPERDLAAAWRELIPSLTFALAVAVAVAVVVAIWLARSIALPLRQITRAAQGMARGNLRQTIPVHGHDEVAQLAASFNTMSQEVERSHRALREFLANASHELRTPLTSIQGFSQALLEGAMPGAEGPVEAGKIINEEAERMRHLVEDLLYLSRVESAEVPVAREPVDVAVLLRESARRLQLVADQRDLTVTLDLAPLPAVPGDATQLDRVFGNLIDNAGKYTPAGGKIAVTARAVSETVTVTVNNTGAVIPAQDLPRIFDRFYRVDKSRARDVEGSGLGLAIAKEVVERHGGTIAVASDFETGTTFTVSLPAPTMPYSEAANRDEPAKRSVKFGVGAGAGAD